VTGSSKGGSGLLEPLEICHYGGIALLCSGNFVMKGHGTGSGGGREGACKCSSEFLGNAASKDLGQQFFRDGGHKHAQNWSW
jgi:hypothetical protein